MSDKVEKKIKILVVDDEDFIRELCREIFEYLGYIYYMAADGRSAVEVAAESHPDVVLLDLYMPKMSGEETLKALREKFPSLKILISSGQDLSEEELEDLKAKGASGFVHKPYSIIDLDAIIKNTMSS